MDNATDGSNCGTKNGCKCVCHKAMGFLIFLIGAIFFLGAIDVLQAKTVAVLWPIFVMVIGLKKVCGKGICKCCSRG